MQGTLADFALGEILQLVAVQGKTGLLRVQNQNKLLTLYFDSGTLVSFRDRRQMAEDPLLQYCTSRGFLSSRDAARIEKEWEGTQTDLADILLQQGYVEEMELGMILESIAQDLIYKSYQWNHGTYRFIVGGEALEGLRYKIACKVEGLLMEAARRIDEWPKLQRRLPTTELLLDKVSEIPKHLDDQSYQVLSQLDTSMTLGTLLRRARLPEFTVYEIVYQAVEAKTVCILEIPEPPKRPMRQAEMPKSVRIASPKRRSLSGSLLWLLAMTVFSASLLGGSLLARRFRTIERLNPGHLLQEAEARRNLQHHIEIYRAVYGAYPVNLQSLVQSEIIDPELVDQARIAKYQRRPDGQDYRLIFLRPTAKDLRAPR